MTRLVNSDEREVASLAYLTVLLAFVQQWGVRGGSELGIMRVVDLQADRLTPKPIHDVIGIAII